VRGGEYGLAVPALHVAVCTNRPPVALEACLRALAAQDPVPEVLIVASGVDATAAAALERAAHRILTDSRSLAEPRTGLSRARNRALAACEGDDDVLAFIDDDAIAAPDWHGQLAAAWERAEAAVACIGGPIHPRFPDPPGTPPAWLGDALLPALTVLDRGPEPLDLDPEVSGVYGANVSFRAGPLRRIGGFDPRFGHHGARTRYAEEIVAERALARLGYVVRYEPGVVVDHCIPPERLTRGSFVRRRFAYGASLGVQRERTRRAAARQSLSSALGAPVAALRGDERRAMERAVRAAENAGVVLAPLIRER